MKLAIFIGLVIYYLFLAMFFAVELDSPMQSSSIDTSKFNVSVNLSSVDVSSGSAFDIPRFLGFLAFGVGLPDSTPSWIAYLFAIWQTLVSITFVIILVMILFGA